MSNKVKQSGNKNSFAFDLSRLLPVGRSSNTFKSMHGSFCSVFVLTKPMTTVGSSVIFRYVKNREDVLYLAFASCFLLDYFVFHPFPFFKCHFPEQINTVRLRTVSAEIKRPSSELIVTLINGKTGIKEIPTRLHAINYFQINGSFYRVFAIAEPVATVCPLVTFRHVKNGEDEFFQAFAFRVFYFHIILFTTFRQGFRFVVKLPKQFFWTIVIIVNPAWEADVRRSGCENLQ